ncbi:MAG: LysR family transcriptional regulator, partial [Beijerinckiaceae bacterium]
MVRPPVDELDARLLRMFEAVYAHRHVTRAAAQLEISQSTLSIGLGQLRQIFGDPLFVRSGAGMAATPLADALIGPVRDALAALARVRAVENAFDPATAVRHFRVAMTDASHITLLPDILGALRMQAPRIGIDVMRIDAQLGDAMQAGRIDLALGYIPALAQGFYHQTHFAQDFICLVGADHPRLHKRLTRVAYAEETHVDIVLGTGRLLIEAGLAKVGLHRHIGLRLPGFLGLSRILAASDLVATLPRHIGET